MARQKNIGVGCFPLETNFLSDIKLRKLIRCQGGKAVTVYVCLLCIIYEKGYYIKWDKDLLFIISEKTGYEEAYIWEVVKSCLAVGLFDKAMWADGVLTSRGIQLRYSQSSPYHKTSIHSYSLLFTFEEKKERNEKEKEAKRNSKERIERNFVVVNAHTREGDGDDFLQKFMGEHQSQAEALCMQLNVSMTELRCAAEAIMQEWELTEATHRDYGDMARHMISQLRIKINQDKTNGSNYKQSAYEQAEQRDQEAAEQARRVANKLLRGGR